MKKEIISLIRKRLCIDEKRKKNQDIMTSEITTEELRPEADVISNEVNREKSRQEGDSQEQENSNLSNLEQPISVELGFFPDATNFERVCNNLIKDSKEQSIYSLFIFFLILLSLLASILFLSLVSDRKIDRLMKSYYHQRTLFFEYKRDEKKKNKLIKTKNFLNQDIKQISFSSIKNSSLIERKDTIQKEIKSLEQKWSSFLPQELPKYPTIKAHPIPIWYFMIAFVVVLSMFLYIYRHYLTKISRLEIYKESYIRCSSAVSLMGRMNDKEGLKELRDALIKNVFEINEKSSKNKSTTQTSDEPENLALIELGKKLLDTLKNIFNTNK